MSASKHLNPKQLKLFMTPDEIMESVSDSVDRAGSYTVVGYETGGQITVPEETMEDLWKTKLAESKGRRQPTSLYNSIKEHGVQRHVTLQMEHDGSLTMGQGHHRVAAAADIAKKTGRQIYIPVAYDDDWGYSDSAEYRKAYPHNVNPVGFDDKGF
jgi:polysaccharide deacetylase 2 family uncharacterized protein YibQ